MTGSKGGRPILILSLPRAGSTWTANVLRRSAGVRFVSEPADAYRWPAAFWAKLGLAEYPTPYALKSKKFQKLWKTVLEHPSYFDEARFGAKLLPRIRASLIRRAVKPRKISLTRSPATQVQPLSKQGSDDRLLIKEVTISFCGGLIADWLDADVLVLRRDPKQVAASWEKMGFPPEPVHKQPWVAREIIQRLDIAVPALETHAERLAWTVGLLDLALMREAKSRDWPIFTHEQLVANPEDEFKEIARVLDLEPTEQMWQFLHKSGSAEGSRYSTSRTAEQLRDSSKGVFSESDQVNLEKVLDLFVEHLPRNLADG